MKHTQSLFMACAAALAAAWPTLPAQAGPDKTPLEVWFDRPTSLKGRMPWYGGHPERWTDGKKPITAGEFGNADPEWEKSSLPIGNGSLGANIMGSVSTERITLNEKSLWRGGPGTSKGAAYYWDVNKQSAHLLKDIRQAFLADDLKKVGQLMPSNFNSPAAYEANGEDPFRFGSFTTLGELYVETGLPDDVSQYRRVLSLDSALTTVSFVSDGIRYDRHAFVSYPDNVMALRFSASAPGKQNLTLSYAPNPLSEGEMTADGTNGLRWRARLDNNGMEYVVRLRALTKGGSVNNHDGKLQVAGADEVVFLLTADTDYKINYDPDFNDPKAYVGVKPAETTAAWLEKSVKKGYKRLLRDHYADYAALFGRVSFTLNDGQGLWKIPTYQRLAEYRKGAHDFGLETLYYQYGRYLLIASSRPGNLPANLQGIWHNNVDGPWRVDYHNNINLQMNYWPALMTNLTECAEPLTDFIRSLQKPGRVTAKAYYGARGWAAGISSNIFGFTAPLAGQDMSWNFNPMAAAWLATHLWDYYEYTQDTDFLRNTAYPILKECAQFTEDYLWEKPDGTLTAAPSTSPEHGPIDEGTTFTHAVAREILLDAIEAAGVLGTDKADADTWKSVLKRMAPYKIGRYGQLMEWSRDIDDPKDHHRHVNHLFGLHPGRTISPVMTPELAKASRVVLEHRGDGATGWSMGWKLNQWARLHDGNHSYLLYGNLLKNGTTDNLWDVHPPFQIDGNFGGTAGVTEMLLQSHLIGIHLLPALPDAWQKGSISGLRAKGNFGVDISWENGRLKEALITSGSGKPCTVYYNGHKTKFATKKGGRYLVTTDGSGLQVKKAH